ncbi:MAG: hypothetical protein SCH71_14685 [Desulfobulbaceae bacterium]|nr:hypothetical protein [Desulfobulbaceae bacterium]
MKGTERSKTAACYCFGLVISILFIAGCAGQQGDYLRDGTEYGRTSGSFTGSWWNYYERGCSFADGRFYREAIADFEKAIAGREKDQWRAATHGMNVIDYFPHRELGIVYYQRKEYGKAVAELENSVADAPSAKGHYFLNMARAAKIKREGLDRSAPDLMLQASSSQEITKKFSKVVTGVADDDTYIGEIMVDRYRVPVEPAQQKKVFSIEVPLVEGENNIRVAATDLAGRSTEKFLSIYSDRRGPQIEIANVIVHPNQAMVTGNISDDKQLVSLRINNRNWPITGFSSTYNFRVTVPEEEITIVAADRAGNITRAIVRRDEFAPDRKNYPQLAMPDMPITPEGISESDADEPLLLSLSDSSDSEPPYIRIENLGPEEEETFEDMLLIEGQVIDTSLLVYISINGEPILNRNGKRVYFSKVKKLDEGINNFHIIAADEHGNKISKRIKVTRKIHPLKQTGSRMSMAILPFGGKGDNSGPDDAFHDQLFDSFMEQGRFRLIEREKTAAILRDLEPSRTDLLDPGEAATIGRLVDAQSVLVGTVIESPDSVEIIGRLIHADTAAILAVHDIYAEEKGPAALGSLLESLAFKFKSEFPLIEGILLEVKDNTALIDAGSDKQIKPGMVFLCYREGPSIKHPVTGRPVGQEPRILGKLMVEEVYETSSRAQIVEREYGFVVSDKVISQ